MQLGKRKYLIKETLNVRRGRFRIRGRGWVTNSASHYDDYNYYAQYRNDPYLEEPDFHLSGSVIQAYNVDGFTREDPPFDLIRELEGYVIMEDFSLVGTGTDPHTAIDFCGNGAFAVACRPNTYQNLGIFHWNVGLDLTLQYGSLVQRCMIRG